MDNNIKTFGALMLTASISIATYGAECDFSSDTLNMYHNSFANHFTMDKASSLTNTVELADNNFFVEMSENEKILEFVKEKYDAEFEVVKISRRENVVFFE